MDDDEEDDLLPLSALRHMVYCPRQAALIHIERLWAENRLRARDFDLRDGGAVWLGDEGRKTVPTAWVERKKEERRHPFLDEVAPLGLVPHLQAHLLARHLRGDLDAYPPWLWK